MTKLLIGSSRINLIKVYHLRHNFPSFWKALEVSLTASLVTNCKSKFSVKMHGDGQLALVQSVIFSDVNCLIGLL